MGKSEFKTILISRYRYTYNHIVDFSLKDKAIIDFFWEWFEAESIFFDGENISDKTQNEDYKKLPFKTYGGQCYFNSMSVNRELRKLGYNYYEGFYIIAGKADNKLDTNPSFETLSHGFNVLNGKVNDITFNSSNAKTAHYYVGVKISDELIDESFKFYKENNANYYSIDNIQLLIAQFLKETEILKDDNNPQYYFGRQHLPIFSELGS